MAIFEACSFQALTGQRVTKVVETVEIIEGRIYLLCQMLDVHSLGNDLPEGIALPPKEQRKKYLILYGPVAAGEGGNHADIDKLF